MVLLGVVEGDGGGSEPVREEAEGVARDVLEAVGLRLAFVGVGVGEDGGEGWGCGGYFFCDGRGG